MATNCTVIQDWKQDGMLIIQNAQTLDKYQAIRNEDDQYKNPEVMWNCDAQEAIIKLKPLLNKGEKIIQFMDDCYATPNGIKMMFEHEVFVKELIKKECDPQEVYYYEYNNYICYQNYYGDAEAIKTVYDIYGEEITRSIKRFNATISIEELHD